MATLNVFYGVVDARVPAFDSNFSAQNITTSGTAAAGTAAAGQNLYARCKAIGGAMYVKPIAPGGTAVAVGTGAHLSDGDAMDFRLPKGWSISVIDAA